MEDDQQPSAVARVAITLNWVALFLGLMGAIDGVRTFQRLKDIWVVKPFPNSAETWSYFAAGVAGGLVFALPGIALTIFLLIRKGKGRVHALLTALACVLVSIFYMAVQSGWIDL